MGCVDQERQEETKATVPPNDFELQTQLLVQILEYILQGHPGDPVAGTACLGAYVQLSSLNYSKSIDRVLTSPSSGSLYKLHLPANPEGFLSQLILGIVAHSDPKGLTGLLRVLPAGVRSRFFSDRRSHSGRPTSAEAFGGWVSSGQSSPARLLRVTKTRIQGHNRKAVW